MFKSNIKRNKRVLILFLLFFGLTIANLSTSIFTNTSEDLNNEFIENITHDTSKDLGRTDDTLQIASYSNATQGTSPTKLNVSLQESILNEGNPLFRITNFNSVYNRTIGVDCPKDTNFNSSFVNISVADIYAPNKTLNIELGDSSSNPLFNYYYGFSLIVPSSCILHNFSLCLQNPSATQATTVLIELHNAIYDYSKKAMKPNSLITSLASQPMGISTPQTWYNFTVDKDLVLTQTENKTFFFVIYRQGNLGTPRFHYTPDNSGDQLDNSLV